MDAETVKLIPRNVSEQYALIGIDKVGNSLTVAMANPLNLHAIEDIELITNCKVQTFVSTQSDIKETIKKYYGSNP